MAQKPSDRDLHGATLTSGSVIVLSFTFILMVVLVVMGAKVDLPVMIAVGPILFVIGILLCLPNLINVVKGKIREHRIRTGKEQPVQTKSWHPEHRFDD